MKMRAEQKKQWRHQFCAVAITLLLPSCSCSEEISDIDPVSMAQDVRVDIGGQSFILPRVAFHRPWRDSERGYLAPPHPPLTALRFGSACMGPQENCSSRVKYVRY